jgi:UDP-N-acetylglucosamine--N-acetylmuramyl-(pentapeptide) pyrophosphoryl-undecaprenol N-acetylglucosamine transferase
MGRKLVIAGGGTGGHIFPAIAIAKALQEKEKDIEILFIGAKDKMEMDKVPEAGYPIEGLDITGFNRSSLIKNAALPVKVLKSFIRAREILKKFKPDAAIGVGGYSTYPVLKSAQMMGIPTFIHESNSFAGKSNKMLGKKATRIFTGTDGMEKFFPAARILVTGNPVRKEIVEAKVTKEEALAFFSLSPDRKTLLIIGGSLGAKAINEAIDKGLDELIDSGLQVVWQTGKPYGETASNRVEGKKSVWANEFITRMEMAYAAADIVVARAGAMTVAELCVVKKPVVFVPYPFAAEDHQTVNAVQLVNKNAALMVKDDEAGESLVSTTISLARDLTRQEELKNNIGRLAVTDADKRIADEIIKALM